MKQITKMRKAVCAMANELRKAGDSLSRAFRKAWKWIKLSMTIRVAGTTFENRQERLQFLKQFQIDNLRVTLERENNSKYDSSAIQIVVHILSIRKKTVIGYVPKTLAKELLKIMEMGLPVEARMMQIIGGYSYKKNLGALINVAV